MDGTRIDAGPNTFQNAVRKISPTHSFGTDEVFLSLNDYNDMRKQVDAAEWMNIFLAPSRNLWKHECSRLKKN